MAQYRSIQALRAIAALMVVVHHLSDRKFLAGAAGVDIFFVISGFIMGCIDTQVRPGDFLTKRAIRIIPLYWATTLALCIGSLAGVFARFGFDSLSLMKSLLFIPYFDAADQIWPLAVPGWTLNAEMLFYGCFAVGLWFGSPKTIAAGAITALVLGGIAFSPDSAPMRFWTMPILMEFVAGLLLASLVRPASLVVGAVLLALGIFALVVIELEWHYNETLRPLVWGGPATLIVCGALAIERAGYWPKRLLVPLERIGDASYSLYLTHGFVVAALHRKLGPSLPVNIVAVPLCLLLAFATFLAFERPVGKALNRRVGDRKRFSDTLPKTTAR